MTFAEKVDNVLEALNGFEIALLRFRDSLWEIRGDVSSAGLGVVPKMSEEFKNQLISVLSQEGFKKARVAKRYGVSRKTIYRWMEELGIENKRKLKEKRNGEEEVMKSSATQPFRVGLGAKRDLQARTD